MFFSNLFANIKSGLKDHWKKITISNKDKPDGTITFDSEGNVVTITEYKKKVVVEIQKPEPKPIVVDVVQDKISSIVNKETPNVIVDTVVATTPTGNVTTSNTTIVIENKSEVANTFVSGLVKNIMEVLKK